jgi:hypothetical protein
MSKSKLIAAAIFGAAIGGAFLNFFNMPKEDKGAFLSYLRKKTHDLLDDAETTVVKVERFMEEVRAKGEGEWVDKLYVLKKMFSELYGSEKRYLL